MKFSQLALVAVAAAVKTPDCDTVKTTTTTEDAMTCTCDVTKPEDCLTLTNKTTYDTYVKGLPASLKASYKKKTAVEKTAFKTDKAADALAAGKLTTAAKTKWTTCSGDAVKKDSKAPVIDAKCEADLVSYLNLEAAENAAKSFSTSSGAVIGIIVGCCVGSLLIGGCALWYCKYHKKKGGDDKMFNHDDLYEAFVDDDQA